MTSTPPSLPPGPRELFIDGVWRAARSARTFAVADPATGEELARVADADAVDAQHALDAAVAAQPGWAATAPRERADLLQRAWRLVGEREAEFALTMTREMGKTLAEARDEVAYGGDFLRWFAEEALRIDGRFGRHPGGTGSMIVSHHPVGPAYLVTPWNFPLAMATRKIAPALAAGCAVVLKPAEATPLTSLLLGAVLQDAGLPPGVVNIVPTSRPAAVSDALLGDPRLRKISFTGSTDVGRLLLRQAAGGVLRTSMELGGNAPFLVFADADLDRAVRAAMQAKFRNIGQACTAANRFLVERPVAGEFARRLAAEIRGLRVGPGTEPGVDVGPLIDRHAVERSAELVADALSRGATLVAGGHPIAGSGTFFEPTLLTDVPADARVAREEIFGPILAIQVVEDEAEAVALANDTEYGLVSYVHTRDLSRTHRLVDLLETGMMGVNTGLVSNAAAPFGGVKSSGTGREGGAEGLHEFLETKYTFVAA